MSAGAFSRTGIPPAVKTLAGIDVLYHRLACASVKGAVHLPRLSSNDSRSGDYRESLLAEEQLEKVQCLASYIRHCEANALLQYCARHHRQRFQKLFGVPFDLHAELVEVLEAIRDTGCLPVELARFEAYRLFDSKGLSSPAGAEGAA